MANAIKPAQLGTVIHATLRTEDLLAAFADELEFRVQKNAQAWSSDAGRAQRDALLALVWGAREADVDTDVDTADELVSELMDALETFAPAGAYFGAHPGDGSDFGFWADETEDDSDPEDSESGRS